METVSEVEPAGAPHLARRTPSADELLAAVEPVLCEALVGQVGASFQVDIALPGGARSSYFIDLSSGHHSSGSCGAFGRVSGASPRGFVLLGSAKWPLVWVKHTGFPSEREHRWKTGSQISSWLAEWDGSGAGGSCLPQAPRGTRVGSTTATLASPHPSLTGTTGGFSGGHGQSGTGLGGQLLERDISGAMQGKLVFSKDCCLQIPPASPLSATWPRLSPCEMMGKMPAGKAGSQTSPLLPPLQAAGELAAASPRAAPTSSWSCRRRTCRTWSWASCAP